jgi:hypothetical protein
MHASAKIARPMGGLMEIKRAGPTQTETLFNREPMTHETIN